MEERFPLGRVDQGTISVSVYFSITNYIVRYTFFSEIVPIFIVCQHNIDILLPILPYFNSIPVEET